MRSRILLASCLLPLLVTATGCAWLFGGGEEEKKPEPALSLVGRVASKPAGSDFVLIESYGDWRVPVGGLLSSFGPEGRSATLVASGEKLGQFAAADVRGGAVATGDAVYYRPLPEAKEPAAAAEKTAEGQPTEPKKPEAFQKEAAPTPAKP